MKTEVDFYEVMVRFVVETMEDDDYAEGDCFEEVQRIIESAGHRGELERVSEVEVKWPVLLEEPDG